MNGYKKRLIINLLQARNVRVPNDACKPYAIVEFEMNEFVTKEAEVSLPSERTSEPRRDYICDSLRDEEVALSLWDRNSDETFLGCVRFKPPVVDGCIHDVWLKYYFAYVRLEPRQPDEPVDGEIRIQMMVEMVQLKSLTPADFELLKVIGRGTYGKVLQVKKKDTGRIFAMKILNKKQIIDRNEVEHILAERNVLTLDPSPFLVSLKFSFQTIEKLYLILDYKNGGELFYHLQQQKFDENMTRFYIGELVLALDHLHKYNIIYRDLKPENVLLDSRGHIALTDFGCAKEQMGHNETTNTFCGTAQYLAPEIVSGRPYGKSVDWWALGILVYELMTGLPPFYSEDVYITYKKITSSEVKIPDWFSPDLGDVCRQLLTKDQFKRLGSGPGDAEDIKRHAFFKDTNWDALSRKEVNPPFKPHVQSEMDTSNFDPEFTTLTVTDSFRRYSKPISETIQERFKDFSYIRESRPGSLHGTPSGGNSLETVAAEESQHGILTFGRVIGDGDGAAESKEDKSDEGQDLIEVEERIEIEKQRESEESIHSKTSTQSTLPQLPGFITKNHVSGIESKITNQASSIKSITKNQATQALDTMLGSSIPADPTHWIYTNNAFQLRH